jgi:3-oxo-5alpha-steroid 4-dehydrogenase
MTNEIFDREELAPLSGSAAGVHLADSHGCNATLRPWGEEVDVVVVGFGGAGASAAIEATARGASVMVVDRFMGGGATEMSGGIAYLGGGTDLQKRAGYNDTPEEMFKYLSLETKNAVSEETLRAFCDTSVENFEWLRGTGVPLPPSGKVVKVSYPSHSCTLYFSGNELSPPYCEAARPAPRGHRALGKGLTGKVLFECLRRAAEKGGAHINCQTQAERLIVDADGTVIGVRLREVAASGPWRPLHRVLFWCATRLGSSNPSAAAFFQKQIRRLEAAHGFNRYVRARGGVVLSAGGFIFNPEMVHHYAPAYATCSVRLGTAGDSGQGIRLGRSVGGAVAEMDRCTAWRFINPPSAWLRGALLARNGRRICNEELYGGAIGEHMAKSHGGRGFLVLDQTAMKASRDQVFRDQMESFQRLFGFVNDFLNCKKARTLDQLGRLCQMPAGALARAIDEYNRGVAAGRDSCGKAREFLYPIDTPPFYAINLDFDNMRFPTPSMTLGGLVVDGITARVVRDDGTPVRGLYAAGRNAVGVSSHSYVSGLSIADCIFSGRNAGRHAAAMAGLPRSRGGALGASQEGVA